MVNKSNQKEVSRIEGATISDILQQIRQAEQNGAKFITSELAELLKGKTYKETARNIWSFIRKNIQYKEDGAHQKIQSPGALWQSRVGDCKSMTVFGASILQKMCVPYNLIVDFYYPDMPTKGHIFIELPDKTILDPVNSKFNEKDKAWKTVQIKGYQICGNSLGSKTKTKNMPTISSYIEGRDQRKERVNVPKRVINYAGLTDGELSVQLVARQNELFYLGTGNKKYLDAKDSLEQVLGNSISGTPIKSNNRLVSWAETIIKERTQPAITAYYFSSLFHTDRARMGQLYTFEQWRENEYNKCVELRQKWAKTSRLRFSERSKLRREWESCFDGVRYLGTVNDQLEKSGAHLLYSFAGNDVNQTVLTKKVLHRIAVDNYSRVFGLSVDNIKLWLRNGIIAGGLENGAGLIDPETAITFLKQNVSENYDQIGAILETLKIIFTIVSIALAATQTILNRIGEVERQRLIANTQGLGTEPFGPEKQDFLNQVSEALTEQGYIIPIGILAAVLFLD